MKKLILSIVLLWVAVGLSAQRHRPQMPENVILSRSASFQIQYGGPTRAEGRSYNFTPKFFIYPDVKLDSNGAEELFASLDIQQILDDNYGTAVIINPIGDKYDPKADFDAFAELFNLFRGPGNLKVVGIGSGATFVNQVIAPKAAGQIAGILTIGGKPGKSVDPAGVPAYIGGKGAAKAAKPYQKAVHADEPLLKVVVNPDAKVSLKSIFADAWDKVLGRNYRFNNYRHTHYDGAKFGEYGAYELEPYLLECESLGMKRIIVDIPSGKDARWLWYEYWPEELLEGAPEHSVPVMVLLHGNTNDPRTQAETSGFIQVAAEDRFFVVEMEWQGSPNYAPMGHDGIESVLYTLFDKYPQLDPSRVYAEGLSAGSMTATAIGVKKSHIFAAVGGHSGGLLERPTVGPFPTFRTIWNEATQKRGAVEMPYCSVFGTMDRVVPYMTPDNWKNNGYLNAWNTYEQMNGMEVVKDMDFSIDPVFGQEVKDRERIVTNKGEGIVVETGLLYKDHIPLIKIVAVMDYGHWNFQPTARIMWDFFKHFRRDPESKKLIYTP